MRKSLWLALALALGISTSAFGATRLVVGDGGGGVDSGNCTVSACATIHYAMSVAAAGDTITLADGTYTNQASITGSAVTDCRAGACTLKSTNNHGATLLFTSAYSPGGSGTFFYPNGKGGWTIDGFVISVNTPMTLFAGISTFASGETFTIQNISGTYLNTARATGLFSLHDFATVNIIGNSWSPTPVCASDPSCGLTGQCDFESNSLYSSFGGLNGQGEQTTTLNVSQNTFGYERNPMTLSNITTFNFNRNTCINPTNHGCFLLYDVGGVVENNIMELDPQQACIGDIMQSSFVDLYCSPGLTVRNNTIVCHGNGCQGMLISMYTNGDAASCSDAVGPQTLGPPGAIDTSVFLKNYEAYNNIIYDGAAAPPFTACAENYQHPQTTGHGFRVDFNMVNSPSQGCFATVNATRYMTFADYQNLDIDGDGTYENNNSSTAIPDFADYHGHNYAPSSVHADMVNRGIAVPGTPVTSNGVTYTCPTLDYNGATRSAIRNCTMGAIDWIDACDSDGVKEAGEACDGTDFGGATCQTYGFTGGSLACIDSCQTISTASCTGSGNIWEYFLKTVGGAWHF